MPDIGGMYGAHDEMMMDNNPVKYEEEDVPDYDMDMHPIEDDDEDEGGGITAEDAWTVISSSFREKGLVRQQLDSFDMFMKSTMQVCCGVVACLDFANRDY